MPVLLESAGNGMAITGLHFILMPCLLYLLSQGSQNADRRGGIREPRSEQVPRSNATSGPAHAEKNTATTVLELSTLKNVLGDRGFQGERG